MERTTTTPLKDSIYNCTTCKKNNDLFRIEKTKVQKIFFIEIVSKDKDTYFICENCDKTFYSISSLKKVEKETIQGKNGIVKEVHKEFKFTDTGASIRTKTITNYDNYIPETANNKLYLETLILLMKFIEEKEKNIDLSLNKFYLKAIEETNFDPDYVSENIESEVLTYIKNCLKEFNKVEMHHLLRITARLVKGRFFISNDVTRFYFEIFDVMGIKQFEKEQYFYGLLEN